ncbi:MAG TPA: AMP-binding protein [Candidatus Elarobacter sp.]|jgi:non-ribosomal peptide synthetase component F
MTATLVDLVCRACAPDASVPDAAGRPVDHVALCNAAHALGSALAARGVEPGDRVACTLPDGAELAASLIGVAAIRAALAPLPPVADEPQARAALRNRAIRALLAPPGVPAGVRAAAAARGIPVLTVELDERGLALVDGEHVYETHGRLAEAEDVAFVPLDGAPRTQADLVEAAGGRGLDGLLAAVTVATAPARRAA